MTGQKRRHRRRHRIPPVRSADENHIVFVEFFRHDDKLRPESGVDLPAGLCDHFLVIGGIRLLRLDFKDISSGLLLNHVGDSPGIAERVRKIDDQHFPRAVRGRAIRIVLLGKRLFRRVSAAGKRQSRK